MIVIKGGGGPIENSRFSWKISIFRLFGFSPYIFEDRSLNFDTTSKNTSYEQKLRNFVFWVAILDFIWRPSLIFYANLCKFQIVETVAIFIRLSYNLKQRTLEPI